MAIILRYATASQEVPLGEFLDSTDGNTQEAALTIANTDIKLWKTGTTTLASKNSGGGTYISNGVYYCTLDATDTNTLGSMVIYCHVSGALATRTECLVLSAVNYDALIAGSDNLDVNAIQVNGTAQTAGDLYGALTTIDDFLDTEVASILAAVDTEVASILEDTGTTLPGTLTTIEGKIDTIDTNVDAVLVDTAFIEKWILDKLTITDNGDGTYTAILYDTNSTTPLSTWVFTTATGSRAKAI
jgi:hypothetical protein